MSRVLWDTVTFGSDIVDYDARKRRQLAFAIVGGLPYIWNQREHRA